MKFKNYQEMYNMLQACHGGKGNHDEVFQTLYQMCIEDEASTFGLWSRDHYQCGHGDMFCTEYSHTNNVDGKEHVFGFYSNNSDTIETDKVFLNAEEAFESTIDYDFLNAIAKMLGKDPIK
jgi:hypothetical protein